MNQLLLALASGLLLLLSSCDAPPAAEAAQEAAQKKQYRQARAAASLHAPHDTIAFGLRFGLDSVWVEARLDSLCRVLEPALLNTSRAVRAELTGLPRPPGATWPGRARRLPTWMKS